MRTIQGYLASNARYSAIDVLGPEDCALCEVEGGEVHICMENGFAKVEPHYDNEVT